MFEPECPIDAIKAHTEAGTIHWIENNMASSKAWPNIDKETAVRARLE
jgi:hypothetical protein